MSFQALQTRETDTGYSNSLVERELSELGEGGVLVRVQWSSLNYKDALSATGNKGVTRQFPHTPGIDAVGVVEEALERYRQFLEKWHQLQDDAAAESAEKEKAETDR